VNASGVMAVARWEFGRFFRWRDQVTSMLITMAIAGIGYVAGCAVGKRVRAPSVQVVVTGVSAEAVAALPGSSRLTLRAADGSSLAALREALVAGAIDGVIAGDGTGHLRLLVVREPRWLDEARLLVDTLVQRDRQRALGLPDDTLRTLAAPIELVVEYVDNSGPATTKTDRIAAAVVMALMLLGVFVGVSYMFVGITGEKQLRVTEQVVAAVSAQRWIDGKILGLSLVAAASTAGYALSAIILVAAARWAGWEVALPDAIGAPGRLV